MYNFIFLSLFNLLFVSNNYSYLIPPQVNNKIKQSNSMQMGQMQDTISNKQSSMQMNMSSKNDSLNTDHKGNKKNKKYTMQMDPNSVVSRTVINTDRPFISQSSNVTPYHFVQTENGFYYNQNGSDRSFTTPLTIWKYGVLPNTEVNIQTSVENIVRPEAMSGITPLIIGFKTKIIDNVYDPRLPFISIYGSLGIPGVATSGFQKRYISPNLILDFSNNISSKLMIMYNAGISWDGFSANPTFLYTIAPLYAILPSLGVYAEAFGNISQGVSAADFKKLNGKFKPSMDAGLLYLVNSSFLLDCSAGVSAYENIPFYISLGISYRFATIRNINSTWIHTNKIKGYNSNNVAH